MIPGSTAHIEIVKAIREDHIGTARSLIRDREVLGRVEREIEFECKRLGDYLNAAQVLPVTGLSHRRLSMRLAQKPRILSLVLERS